MAYFLKMSYRSMVLSCVTVFLHNENVSLDVVQGLYSVVLDGPTTELCPYCEKDKVI